MNVNLESFRKTEQSFASDDEDNEEEKDENRWGQKKIPFYLFIKENNNNKF